MRNDSLWSRVMATGTLAAGVWISGADAGAADWEWTIVPYVWASDVGLDVDVSGDPVIAADVSFQDLLDKLDVGAQIHFEGRKGKGGFFVDLTFLSLSDDRTTSPDPPLPGGTVIESSLDTGLYEGAGFYRPKGGERGFDVLFGVRVIDQEQVVEVTFPPPSSASTSSEISPTLTDGFIGARYTGAIGRKWAWGIRGDVGSGDTDVTWSANGLFSFTFDQAGHYTLAFGYRHMEIDFDEAGGGKDVSTTATFSGPLIGFAFRF